MRRADIPNYLRKAWTRHEIRQAQARAFAQDNEYILPLRLDNSELPGLNSTIGYIDALAIPITEIVNLILEKLGLDAVNVSERLRRNWDGLFVEHDGFRMVSYWPSLIDRAQQARTLTFKQNISRIRYGEELGFRAFVVKPHCRDCGVRVGLFHVMNCCVEECPNCHGQLLSCRCRTTQDSVIEDEGDGPPQVARVFGFQNSPAVKQARKWLDEFSAVYQFHDFRRHGVVESELERWIAESGWSKLLDRKSLAFRDLLIPKNRRVTGKLAKEAMLLDPRTINAPILEFGDQVVVGFEIDAYRSLFARI